MAPAKKGSEKGQPTINRVVTSEYRIHEVGFKKPVPWALKEVQKFAMKEMGTPDVHIYTRLNKDIWVKDIRDVPYQICLYMLVTHMPFATFRNLQTVSMVEI
ncbi:hypothetical protein K5549_008212 [Capra hircus]|uniref:Uncharacterized protein n=1 Tax=Capra hircus TaxID=9925 RepID=A0A452E3R8_CAPHI|nr:hypothetical protein K5549_008212 [Capra hircus]